MLGRCHSSCDGLINLLKIRHSEVTCGRSSLAAVLAIQWT